MAAVVGSAEVLVRPSFKGFQTNVASQMASASKVGANSYAQATEKAGLGSRIASGIGKGLKVGAAASGAAVAGIFGYSLKKGFERLNSIEQAQAKLKGLGNSAKDVQNIMDNALKSVKGTAFGLDEAATVAASAVAAGVKPGQQLTKYLTLTADAATIAGVSMSDMGSILNKVTASGKAQNDTLKQLSDQGIPIYQMLGKELHKSAGEIFDMASAGQISAKQLQTALQKGVGGAALTAGSTVAGAFKNMQAALGRFGAAFLEKLFPHFQKSFVNLTTFIDNATKAIGPLANIIGAKLGGALEKVTGFLAHMDFSSFSGWLASVKSGTPSMSKFGTAAASIGSSLKTWAGSVDFSAILSKIAGAAAAATPTVKQFLSALPNIASGIGKGLIDFWHALVPALQSLGPIAATLGTTLGKLLGGAISLVANHIDTIVKLLPVIVAGFLAYRAATEVSAAATFALQTAQVKMLPVQTLSNALRVTAELLARSNAKAIAQETVATETNTAAKSGGLVTMAKTAAAFVAQRVAMVATAVAQKAVTAAQWLMNAAMSANPIGLVVIAIAALVAGFIVAYKKSETFRKIVNAAWAGIKKAALAVVGWFTGSFLPFFTKTIPNGFQAVVSWVKRHWPLILGLLTGPIGLAVVGIVKHKDKIVGTFKKMLGWVTGTFQKGWSAVKGVLSGAVDKGRSAISSTKDKIVGTFSKLKTWGTGTFKKNWAAMKGVIHDPVGSARSALSVTKGKIEGVFNTLDHFGQKIFGPKWAGIKSVFTEPIDKVVSYLKGVFGKGGGGVRQIFNDFITAAGNIFDKVKSVVSKPIGWLLDHVINPALFGGINTVLKFVGQPTLKPISTKGFASGGVFEPNRYTPGRDIGYAALSGYESIMRPEFTKAAGEGWVNAANQAAIRGGVGGAKAFLAGQNYGAFAGGGIAWPTNTKRLSPTYPGHSGVDIAAGMGAPIYAAADGRITYTGWGHGYGQAIFEKMASGLDVVYGHTSKLLTAAGQAVRAGQLIGRVGATGHATGPHLHIEIDKSAFGTASNRAATLSWLGGAGEPQSGGGFLGKLVDIINPSKAISGAVDKALTGFSRFGKSPAMDMLKAVPGALASKAVDWAKDKLSLFGGSSSGSGSGQWAGVIKTALAANGLPTSADMVNAWLKQVQTESGGNPRAIQGIQDVNSASGNLARGLLQVIPPTFAAFKFPGHGDIFNPLDNALAAIHYAKSRYPNLLSVIGHGHGYKDGTMSAQRGWKWVGEREPELVHFRGGEQVYNGAMLASMSRRGNSGPQRISGTLDLGNGLRGYVEGVLEERIEQESGAV